MSSNLIARLLKSEDGAVAPTIGMSLFALVAAGGIAFDYARMATLDTELQNAADQAALAAATQLDGKTNARSRATSAAQTLVTNLTLMANDTVGSRAITVPTVTFYKEKEKIPANLATTDAEANFVLVTVGTRQAFFALTPIVAAISSGQIAAAAYAGVGSAICKVPPVMLCNPDEPNNNADESYLFSATVGAGLKLITGSATAPGNFGWLEAGLGNGTPELAGALGYNAPPGDCQPLSGVSTKTGMDAAVLKAFNTRFDIYANGNMTCPSQNNGTCSPSTNTRKDLICASNNGTQCNNDNWTASANPYRPDSVAALNIDGSEDPDVMGFPRDICHAVAPASQTCGIVGNGTWDRDAYFRVNYGWSDASAWMTGTGLPANATRYQVYNWELSHPTVVVNSVGRGIDVPQVLGGKDTAFGRPATGRTGVAPSALDRRRISAAVLNCRALNLHGKTSNIPVPLWLDLFLVEPAFQRGKGANAFTDEKDIYVEVIAVTGSGLNGASTAQVVQRSVPYLVE